MTHAFKFWHNYRRANETGFLILGIFTSSVWTLLQVRNEPKGWLHSQAWELLAALDKYPFTPVHYTLSHVLATLL